MSKAVVVLSGGMDSAVALAMAVKDFSYVSAIHFNYGQHTSKTEEMAAKNLASHYSVHLTVVNVPYIKGNSLTGEGDTTEVLGRNPLMALWAVNLFSNWVDTSIVLGIQGSDSTDYADCTVDAVLALKNLIEVSTREQMTLYTPLLKMDKVDIVKKGISLGVPFGMTYSCYFNPEHPCGECDSCKKRAEGFAKAGAYDPLTSKIIYNEKEVQDAVKLLREELLTRVKKGYRPLVVVVEQGGRWLWDELKKDDTINGLPEYHGKFDELMYMKPFGDRDILIVDDFLDTGDTIQSLKGHFLVDCQCKTVDFITLCYRVPKKTNTSLIKNALPIEKGWFLYGCGMDDKNGNHRNLPYIVGDKIYTTEEDDV